MTIAFIHPHKAFLPEIAAYQAFFEKFGIRTLVSSPQQNDTTAADVKWYFMGQARPSKKDIIVIHEYTSASTPPLAPLKNWVKRMTAPKPSFRIFQNEYVQKALGFHDNIPSGIRRHAITPLPAASSDHPEKQYDFIYVGTVDKARQLDKLFTQFITGPLKTHNLLVLSMDYAALQQQLGSPQNIHFKGPVPPAAVAGYIRQARYGINFIPDKQPYNRQPSGKFLDYAACQIPIITTDYQWIRDFQQQTGGNYYYLLPDLSNFEWDAISRFDYQSPNLTGWTWEDQLRSSGILRFLTSRFPDLHFTQGPSTRQTQDTHI